MSDVSLPLLSALQVAPSRIANGVLLALSGGLDSCALLHAWLACHGPTGLRVIHVDHGLQADSANWAQHCREVCDAHQLPLLIESLTLDSASSNLEALAREARYAAFRRHLQTGECLLTAHHQDDQAETFLLRALRGAGPGGLAAMRAWRDFGAGQHWRPWLDISRDAIRAYTARHAIAHVDDPSNDNLRFERNFLRQQVLPLLRSRWPQASRLFSLSAHWCAEADAALNQNDDALLASLSDESGSMLRTAALRVLPADTRSRVLRRWVLRLGLPPLPLASARAIEHDLLSARHDSEAHCDWSGARVQHWRGQLYALRLADNLVHAFDLDWDGQGWLHLPDGSHLALCAGRSGAANNASPSAWTQTFRVRSRRGGERIQLPGRPHRHKLKHLLQQADLPPWQRARVPLLFAPDGELLAAGDICVSDRLHRLLQSSHRELRWVRP